MDGMRTVLPSWHKVSLVVWKLGRLGRPRSLGEGRSRSRRPHPSSASDSTNRTRSACRERECFW